MKNLFAFLSVLLVFGCSSDGSSNDLSMIPGVDYYKFSSEDKSKLLNSTLDKNKTLTFRDQSGQQLSYKVTASYKDRADDGTGTFSGGNGVPSHYYDRQLVSLQSVDFPASENSGISVIVYKPSASGLMADLYFDRWNDGGYWEKQQLALSNASFTTVTFGGKIYKKVIVLNSQIPNSTMGDGFPMNANKLFYDLNFGLVAFDDLDGNEWRRVNP